jgi:hypothetical protein
MCAIGMKPEAGLRQPKSLNPLVQHSEVPSIQELQEIPYPNYNIKIPEIQPLTRQKFQISQSC